MMASATGFQVIGIVDGGLLNKGEEVAFRIRISDGCNDSDLTLLLSEELLAAFVGHLITYGSMASAARLRDNPLGETDGLIGAYTLGLSDVIPGRSVTDPRYAVLTLQFDAGNDRKLNLHCTADANVLSAISRACRQAAEMLQGNDPEFLPH